MRITIAICTWNRCQLLRQTLEGMTKLSVPTDISWELLVVNNNSTDATDEVITSFKERLPIRGLFEPRPGKSNALNLAIRESSGEYIIFTDNDVLVDEEWLASYYRAFNRWPNATIFGGSIHPWFEGNPPQWLHRILSEVGGAYGIRELGDEPIPLSYNVLPYGANMAVRKAEQARYLYDASLGPRPNSPLRGEETTMVRQMLAAGAEGWWIPQARVRHYVPKEHQTTRFLRGFFSGMGEQGVIQMPEDTGPMIFGRPRWLWRKTLTAELRYRMRRVLTRPEVWIEDLRVSSDAWGQMRGHAARSRKRREFV
jgi:glucosyl-dolichyl phosphate glucuronosyltransferase